MPAPTGFDIPAMEEAVNGNDGTTMNVGTASGFANGEYNPIDQALHDVRFGNDSASKDKLFDYYSQRELLKLYQDWEDQKTQKYLDVLKANGISPYFLSGSIPAAGSASGSGVSGSQYTSKESSIRSKRTQDTSNALGVFGSIMDVLGSIIMAMAIAA